MNMHQKFQSTTKPYEGADLPQQSMFIQPMLTLPAKLERLPAISFNQPELKQENNRIDQTDPDESTVILPAFFVSDTESVTGELATTTELIAEKPLFVRKKKLLRGTALILCVGLALAFYLSWRGLMGGNAAVPVVTQQSSNSPSTVQSTTNSTSTSSNSSSNTPASVESSETIEVYILGAVKHPGVYVLTSGARVYELVQRAGGLLPHANVVALNLAAKLVDGEEIYVQSIGETPPSIVNNTSNAGNASNGTATPGQTVNVNTATADELRQGLHVSAATAQKIVDYRIQHGPYTAVSQLLQAVSQSIYDRIKNMVTV